MDSENTDKYKGLNIAAFIFECVMALVYLALGIILLFTKLLSSNFSYLNLGAGVRIGLGVILALYGIARVYRAYKKISWEK